MSDENVEFNKPIPTKTNNKIEIEKEPTLQYQNRIVAFIDILGFKAKISHNRDIHDSIKGMYAEIRQLTSPTIWSLFSEFFPVAKNAKMPRVFISSFSDCIVISAEPLKRKSKIETDFSIPYVLFLSAYYSSKVLGVGFLTRGGVSIGECFHEIKHSEVSGSQTPSIYSDIVFGPAMIEAYLMEENHAVYPRIIVHRDLKNKINNLPSKQKEISTKLLSQDGKDGPWGITSLSLAKITKKDEFSNENINVCKIFCDSKKIIEDGLDTSHHEPNNYKHYRWLKDIHNAAINESEDYKNFEIKKS